MTPTRAAEVSADIAFTCAERLAACFDDGDNLATALSGMMPGMDPARPSLRGLRLGSEFCDRLVPSPEEFRCCAEHCEQAGLPLALVTPIVSDGGLRRVERLLALLPDGAEVVVNDWGVLALLRRQRPDLAVVAGRLLCKMIKDPRLPSPEWARLYPHGAHARPFHDLLARFGVGRLEVDVPPYAACEDFRSGGPMAVSVHLPHGYVVKGRQCWIGSLNQQKGRKFAPGHGCERECLTYLATMSRPDRGGHDLATVQFGNTLFYRHSEDMSAAAVAAVNRGWVDRIVIPGEPM